MSRYIPSLKEQYFESLGVLHDDLKRLKNSLQPAKNDVYRTIFAKGLTKVIRPVWRVLQYSTTDEAFHELISHSTRLLNILINKIALVPFGLEGIKEQAHKLYTSLTALLNNNIQLSLFYYGDEFGWYASPGLNEPPVIENVRKSLWVWYGRDQEKNLVDTFLKRVQERQSKPIQLQLFDPLLYA